MEGDNNLQTLLFSFSWSRLLSVFVLIINIFFFICSLKEMVLWL